MSFRPRVTLASPSVDDCRALSEWLAAEGYEPSAIQNPARLTAELPTRMLEMLVVDAKFAATALAALRMRSGAVPVAIVGDPDPVAEAHAITRGMAYLVRPLDRTLVVCSVAMAIMESRPARRSERKRARVDAVVRGVASRIIDLSKEGMRLEIPRVKHAAPPPPVFDVGLPMLGVSLTVRRMWTATPPEMGPDAIWYGGELSNNSRRVELAWHTLVDALPRARLQVIQ
jgi:hypothetical protein